LTFLEADLYCFHVQQGNFKGTQMIKTVNMIYHEGDEVWIPRSGYTNENINLSMISKSHRQRAVASFDNGLALRCVRCDPRHPMLEFYGDIILVCANGNVYDLRDRGSDRPTQNFIGQRGVDLASEFAKGDEYWSSDYINAIDDVDCTNLPSTHTKDATKRYVGGGLYQFQDSKNDDVSWKMNIKIGDLLVRGQEVFKVFGGGVTRIGNTGSGNVTTGNEIVDTVHAPLPPTVTVGEFSLIIAHSQKLNR
jgi:hypothetical protein